MYNLFTLTLLLKSILNQRINGEQTIVSCRQCSGERIRLYRKDAASDLNDFSAKVKNLTYDTHCVNADAAATSGNRCVRGRSSDSFRTSDLHCGKAAHCRQVIQRKTVYDHWNYTDCQRRSLLHLQQRRTGSWIRPALLLRLRVGSCLSWILDWQFGKSCWIFLWEGNCCKCMKVTNKSKSSVNGTTNRILKSSFQLVTSLGWLGRKHQRD